jgi:lysophospholipase L1-like esterase
MSKEHLKNNPIILITLTIIFVIVLSHFLKGITIFGYQIQPVDLFIDIKPDSLVGYNSNNNELKNSAQNDFTHNFITKNHYLNFGNYKVNTDAILASVSSNLIESLFSKNITADENNIFSEYQSINIKEVPLTGNVEQMKYFFNALKKTGTEQIRVAHYGDSGEEGDNITADIREPLQKEFGGAGVGMLSITSEDANFRMTTKQTFSNNWNTITVYTNNPNNIPLGVNGFVSIPEGISWVQYQTTGWKTNLKSFSLVRIFYSNAKNSSIKYSFDGTAEQTAVLKPGNAVQELILKAPNGAAHSIKIITTMADQAYFYGVSLENGNGVYVDNFPWRGNTGLGFTNISESSLKQFGKLLNYKLLLLSFGANETSFGSGDNSWYENQMVKVINNLKKAFPETSIILLGVGDRAIKRGTRFVTDPAVPALIKTQESIASKTGIAFWNLFEAMGGQNSMEAWVKANLCLMDYTHPSLKGAQKIGNMIAEAIIDAYKKENK